jgi:hypothetical protein
MHAAITAMYEPTLHVHGPCILASRNTRTIRYSPMAYSVIITAQLTQHHVRLSLM